MTRMIGMLAVAGMLVVGCAPAAVECSAFTNGPCTTDEDCDPGGPSNGLVCARVSMPGQTSNYQCVVGLAHDTGMETDCRNRGGVVATSPHYGMANFTVCMPPDGCRRSDAGTVRD
jgi:hypothetical protein